MIFLAASILRPYISEKNYWILQHHEVTQTEKRSHKYLTKIDFPNLLLWQSLECGSQPQRGIQLQSVLWGHRMNLFIKIHPYIYLGLHKVLSGIRSNSLWSSLWKHVPSRVCFFLISWTLVKFPILLYNRFYPMVLEVFSRPAYSVHDKLDAMSSTKKKICYWIKQVMKKTMIVRVNLMDNLGFR